MSIFKRFQGDVKDVVVVEIDGVDDLSSVASITVSVKRDKLATETTHPAAVGLTATVLDPVARTVLVQLGGAGGWLETARAADWYMLIHILFLDGTRITWGEDLIQVHKSY